MPAINVPLGAPLGALPARFRRQRLLLVGCGDVGLRVARLLRGRVQLMALTSSPARVPLLRAAGLRPLAGNLDRPASLRRLAGLATRVLHLAPPRAEEGQVAAATHRPATDRPVPDGDPRSWALAQALRRRTPPAALVYGSTSGVYGDCGGARVAEHRAPRPASARARRRLDAEQALRTLVRAGVAVRVLRIPGIYAPDRVGGTPRERLLRGTPALRAEDDVYTSHIHADDLARACVAALWRGGAPRVFHASDDSALKMGDYFDLAADLYGLPRPPRIERAQAQQQLPATLLSFMSESRRLDNARLKRELRVRLRYPDVAAGLTTVPRF